MSDVMRVTIDSLSQYGEGIAHSEGKEIYIAQALPGADLEVSVGEPFAKGSKRCPGTVVNIIAPSPLAATAIICDHFGHCGGCQLMHMDYAEQVKLKRDMIKQSFIKAATKAACEDLVAQADTLVQETVANTSVQSRFKSIRYFAENAEGLLVSGYYAARSHQLVEVSHCPLEPARFGTLAQSLTSLLQSLGLKSYKGEQSQAAEVLRAMQLRAGDGDQVFVSLIIAAPLAAEQKEALCSWANDQVLTCFTLGLNTKPGNALFTQDHEVLVGSGSMQRSLLEKRFTVGPNTFLQVNYDICEKLYQAAVAHCALSESKDVALDLCCGVGTMSLALADHFKHVIGVEIVEDSIKAAEANAQANGITNTKFIAADVKEILPSLVKSDNAGHVGAIIADPARAGLGEATVRVLTHKLKQKLQLSLIYCSLTAFERELPSFLKAGFTVDAIQGFDMFPHSMHVETLVLLSRK